MEIMLNRGDSTVIPNAFDEMAADYDVWYDKNPLFQSELEALREVASASFRSVEVGVGSGRFSQAMGIKFGVDPAPNMLALAKDRGVLCVQALAEALPFKESGLDRVFFIFSICFLDDLLRALDEAATVLKKGGVLVIGFIPKDSEWGEFYEQKRRQGHCLYKHATFFRLNDLMASVEKTHFRMIGAASTLFHSPAIQKHQPETPRKGFHPKAGFIVVAAERL